MLANPKLYEINTRVWIKQFGSKATLADVPAEYFKELAEKGINVVWLMGIWKTCPDIIKDCCFSNDLTASYTKALPGWGQDDIAGSPYSINTYELNPVLGNKQDLLKVREIINGFGMKLVLDFVPNHFGAGTEYIKSNPDIFLQADDDSLGKDSYTFFKVDGKVFAHGRDPLFPAWTDTIQINLYSPEAREFLTNIMIELSGLCDGLRCDMAMLPMNNVFYNTWLGIHNKYNVQKPKEEFWKESIARVRKQVPDFMFIAEVYWGLEWELQQLGFSFTYDKRMLERLLSNDIYGIKAHLQAEKIFQAKSVRFIENHDEQRSVTMFGKSRALAAATIITTISGMKLYYDGQFSGRRVKLPVQLCRQPEEKISNTVTRYYDKLLKVTKDEIFSKGEWQMLEPMPLDSTNFSFERLFAWQWRLKDRLALVIINYSDGTAQCRLRFNPLSEKHNIVLVDKLTEIRYKRSVDEIRSLGLYVELKAYNSHIFFVEEK
jgi:glycosidase